MFFFSTANVVSAKLQAMKSAESALMKLARQFGNRTNDEYEMQLFDTFIPSFVIPLQQNNATDQIQVNEESSSSSLCEGAKAATSSSSSSLSSPQMLTIHGVRVENKNNDTTTTTTMTTNTPLVLLHGYANGGLYFYRNLVGLSRYFSTVYSLDWLGWGLSSRPKFYLSDDTTETAEDFFVESLEAWRKANKIPKMILAGHSMGGYMSVAYCEKYPQHVERLILLSPAGVPEETPELIAKREAWRERVTSSWRGQTIMTILPSLFDGGYTPCGLLRTVPEKTGLGWVNGYVSRRLPAITNPEEQTTIASYLYHNATLPGSAEYALNRVLRMDAMGRKPLESRICHLKVPQVIFLYGDDDWMDSSGGLAAERACRRRQQQQQQVSPQVDVLEVPKAGHLLMLDNWASVNAGIIVGGLGITLQQASDVLTKEDAAVVPRKLDAGILSSTSTTTDTTTARIMTNSTSTLSTNNDAPQQTTVSVQA